MKAIGQACRKESCVPAPPSKAHTLRALVIASLAKGTSIIRRPLLGEDQLHVIDCLRRLGVAVDQRPDRVAVDGCAGQYKPIAESLDVGESGVGMNFLTAACCLSQKPVVISGNAPANTAFTTSTSSSAPLLISSLPAAWIASPPGRFDSGCSVW